MTAAAPVATVLVVLALLDGTFSGFRASLGRTGLVRHRPADLRAARYGLAAVTVALVPAVVVGAVDAVVRPGALAAATRAGTALLWACGPLAVLVLLALAAYFVLGWQQRYLATAVVLGPLTLLRPWVVLGGGVAAVVVGRDPVTGVVTGLGVAAVLVVEPWCARRFRGELSPAAPAPGTGARRA